MSSNVSNKIENDWIPDGFLLIKGPDDEKYIVPEFMVQALEQEFYSNKKKEELNVFKLSGTVFENFSKYHETVGEGLIMTPTVPGTSDRERLAAHSEVLVLQERLGISYKDAAHRLYMAELERVKRDQSMYKAFAGLGSSTKKTLEMAYKAISAIDDVSEGEKHCSND